MKASHRQPARASAHQHAVRRALLVCGGAGLMGYIAAVVTTPVPGPTRARAGAAGVPTVAAARASEAPVMSTSASSESLMPAPEVSWDRLESSPDSGAPLSIAEVESSLVSSVGPLTSDPGRSCPHGMVLVEGQFCPSLAHRCLDYLSVERDRCAEYAETSRCFGKPVPLRFCIDEFEYPNVRGVKPEVAVSYIKARQLCAEQGKRLCTEREWTLACEGPERLPYPTGRRRDENACNYDKPYRFPDNDAYANPRTRGAEIARLDQRVASGEMAECVSAYGVHDMTGNVDEWVYNEAGSQTERPYVSGLKGGYWGPVRNRCRPMTVDHNAWHSGYQIGFRCCADGQDQSTDLGSEARDAEPTAAALSEEAQISG